jgi:hypothetical protein
MKAVGQGKSMSDRNVELHRRAVVVFNARDAEAFVGLGDPRIEFHSLMTIPGGATYHGHDGVRTFFKDLADAWGDDFVSNRRRISTSASSASPS